MPSLITTANPGTFAHNTLKTRVPAIVRETIDLNRFPPKIVSALENLHAELVGGRVRGLQEDAPDRAFWDLAAAPHAGHSWLDVPWYWAEAYVYRRILEATGYFQPGPMQGFDPFAVKKQGEWQPTAAPAAVERLLGHLPADDPEARFRALFQASLWGNRADLSYEVAARLAREEPDAPTDAFLLADDTAAVWQHLAATRNSHPAPRIALIADNAGTELLMDLALADGLLGLGLVARVDLHLKPQPFFVSDAMVRDVAAGLQALPGGGPRARQLALRLWAAIDSGRLRLRTHWFYASSLFYHQLPADLSGDLAAANLVIVKGDANYRRLLGDADWPLTTPFAAAVSYFPAPLVALRTLKAELFVGLADEAEAARLRAEDPDWMVNGRRGVIQFCG